MHHRFFLKRNKLKSLPQQWKVQGRCRIRLCSKFTKLPTSSFSLTWQAYRCWKLSLNKGHYLIYLFTFVCADQVGSDESEPRHSSSGSHFSSASSSLPTQPELIATSQKINESDRNECPQSRISSNLPSSTCAVATSKSGKNSSVAPTYSCQVCGRSFKRRGPHPGAV